MLLNLQVMPLVVVTGYRAEDMIQELEGLALTPVYNAEWKQGMGSSIACGVQNVPGDIDGVMLMLCDQWRVGRNDLSAIITAWKSDISRIYTASWKSKNRTVSGPPAIFPRSLIQELKCVDKDKGAKTVINRHENVSHVKMENAVFDLDGPEDLEQLVNRYDQLRRPGRNPGAS